MALPSSGALSMSQVNTELGKGASTSISLNDANVRSLAGKSSGAISFGDLLGKSSVAVAVNTTLTVGYKDYNNKGYSDGDYGNLATKVFTLPSGKQIHIFSIYTTSAVSGMVITAPGTTWTEEQGTAVVAEINDKMKTIVLNGIKYSAGNYIFDAKLGWVSATPGYPYTVFDGKTGQEWPLQFTDETL